LFSPPLPSPQRKIAKGADLLRQLEVDFVADVAKHGHAPFSLTSPKMASNSWTAAASTAKTHAQATLVARWHDPHVDARHSGNGRIGDLGYTYGN